MVHRAQTLIALTALLTACAPAPDYPVPPQKRMPAGPEPLPSATFMRMSNPAADSVIEEDILHAEPGSAWRWTNQHPRVKLWVDTNSGWQFHVKFTFAGVILKETGPITLRFLVNDKELATQTFTTEREYEYSKPVPAAMLNANEPNTAGFDIDRVYVSKTDGVKLGVLLQEIGFQRVP